jgi:hypothetical protein
MALKKVAVSYEFDGRQFPHQEGHSKIFHCIIANVDVKFFGEQRGIAEISKEPGWAIDARPRAPSVVWVDISGVQRYNAT